MTMRILKGNKELTSPSIAASLILTNTQVKQEEEIRKQNELNRQSTYEQTKQMAQNALNKANGMTQLKTGKFADRPVTPDGKMLYLATDKASGNPDQYTIYDVSPVIMDHEVSNIPDVSVAKGMALVVFPDFDDTVELPHIITWSTNGILFVAYSASEAVASNDDYDYYIGFNSRTSFIQLQNEGSDWIFSNACSPESGEFDAGYVAVTKNEISETGYADLLSKVTDSNYSIKDLINHDQAYYDGGGTEYFFGVSSTEDVWSWHNGIGGSSDLTGYPLLETGLFADRPASPSNKMLYLATDKASGDQDRYTIYDKEYTIGNPYTQFNVPDITEAKALAKANNASFDDSLDLTKISKVLGPDGTTITVWYTSGEMFVFNNTANSSYELAFARTPMIVLAYIEGTWTVLQAVNSDDAGFSDLYGTTEVMSFTSATDDAAGYNELIGLIQGANYNVRDYINHDEAYYTGGGAEYFVNETPIDNVWVWSISE
jgi:hypothetical protein